MSSETSLNPHEVLALAEVLIEEVFEAPEVYLSDAFSVEQAYNYFDTTWYYDAQDAGEAIPPQEVFSAALKKALEAGAGAEIEQMNEALRNIGFERAELDGMTPRSPPTVSYQAEGPVA